MRIMIVALMSLLLTNSSLFGHELSTGTGATSTDKPKPKTSSTKATATSKDSSKSKGTTVSRSPVVKKAMEATSSALAKSATVKASSTTPSKSSVSAKAVVSTGKKVAVKETPKKTSAFKKGVIGSEPNDTTPKPTVSKLRPEPPTTTSKTAKSKGKISGTPVPVVASKPASKPKPVVMVSNPRPKKIVAGRPTPADDFKMVARPPTAPTDEFTKDEEVPFSSSAACGAAVSCPEVFINAPGGLNVRPSADRNQGPLGLIDDGAVATVCAEEEYGENISDGPYGSQTVWYQIVFGNQVGWVSASWVACADGTEDALELGDGELFGSNSDVEFEEDEFVDVIEEDEVWVEEDDNAGDFNQ